MERIRTSALRLSITVAIAWGCASTPQSSRVPSSDGVDPCPVRLASTDTEAWRAVKADGFTFCVPPDWQPRGARAWRGPGGTVTWTRSPTAGQEGKRMRFVVAERGAVPPASSAIVPQGESTVETIGGVSVEIRTTTVGSKFNAFADWTSPTLHFEGSPTGRTDAERYVDIFRTVRIAANPE